MKNFFNAIRSFFGSQSKSGLSGKSIDQFLAEARDGMIAKVQARLRTTEIALNLHRRELERAVKQKKRRKELREGIAKLEEIEAGYRQQLEDLGAA